MDITATIESATAASRAGILQSAQRLATAMTGPESSRDFEGPMKETVRRELFTEALLGAAHARFEEIKTATER